MKALFKILSRYVGAAIGVGIFLLLLNLIMMVIFVLQCAQVEPETNAQISLIADGIKQQEDGSFSISTDARTVLSEQYAWCMQLNDAGDVIWSDRMPHNLPQHYTASDIASFSRWYLEDYPVSVWSDSDGLLVLASAQGSEWKYLLQTPIYIVDQAILWLPYTLFMNLLAAFLLALMLGWRMYRAAAPLAQGISNLAQGEATKLPERGVFGTLATDLNRTSNQLLSQRALLHKRDRTRTEWIAGVSHDIRTPLSLVQGNAAQLEADTTLSEQARQKARTVREQSQRIGRLVSDLNLASKLEYELQPLHMTDFHPAAMLRAAAADTLNSTSEKSAHIDLKISPDLGDLIVKGDEALLRRAVDNLLRNSILHNDDGVHITLTLEACTQTWSILVADDGKGISEQLLQQMRQPTAEGIPKHGLGLVLVRQIAHAHGGRAHFVNTHPGLLVRLSFLR